MKLKLILTAILTLLAAAHTAFADGHQCKINQDCEHGEHCTEKHCSK